MALKQLILHKRISGLKDQLEVLRKKDTEFVIRKEAITTREAELEAAVNELTAESTEEEKAVVDESVAAFETDQEALATEETENGVEKKKLEDEIRDIQKELDEIDSRAATPPLTPKAQGQEQKRGGDTIMRGNGFFVGMNVEQRSALLARDEVKEFLTRTRELLGKQRAVTGAELTIPEVMLDLLRDNLHRYSKLITKVRLKTVTGKARQTVAGTIPEGIWMETIGNLNELSISFNQIEVDGYKVGGFVPIPNSTLEDSDLNLANEIMDALGQAIGFAVDKAIAYGTGTKMPLGFVTRLAQLAQPGIWGTNAPAWVDLHITNLLKFDPAGLTPEAFFAALILKLGEAKPNYAAGGTFWCMNRKTRMTIMSKAIAFNAAGAIVAGMNGTIPVEGGEIVELDFVPDNDIIGGFGSLYLLAERAGAQFAASEHVRFIEDQTVFKGTARYDGAPAIGAGFVALNIGNTDPTTAVLFVQDEANTVATPKAMPVAGAYTGAQSVALTCDTAGALIYYTVDGSTPDATKTLYNGPIAVAATATIKAIGIKTGMTSSAVLSAAYTISA